jgi:hypothetical protein
LSYQDGDLAATTSGGSFSIRPDHFYRQKIHTAMRQYLSMRKQAGMGPATLPEIYSGLCEGGLKFETDNEENRKTNMRSLLRKNTSIFHRMPDKVHFALAEWYGVNDEDDEENEKKLRKKGRRSKSKRDKKNANKPAKNEAVIDAGKSGTPRRADAVGPTAGKSVTQEQAVRAALDGINGTFKRQEVVDWIDKQYPAVHAAQKRSSIFAMLSKLGDEIETVTEAKGSEPAVYRRKAMMQH